MKKQDLVDKLNREIDDNYEVTDIFFNTTEGCGRLRFCGYRNLSKFYEFREIVILFNDRPNDYLALQKQIKGLYYMGSSKEKGSKTLYSTDISFVNTLKLFGNNFDRMTNSFLSKKRA